MQVFLHFFLPAALAQKVGEKLISHQRVPRPLMVLSSLAASMAASHAFLQVSFGLLHTFFLQYFFVLPSPMHSSLHLSNLSAQSPLHCSKSSAL